jgi:hypothetical protein
MLDKTERFVFRVYAHSSEMKNKRTSITSLHLRREDSANFLRSDLKINLLALVLTQTGGSRL